MDRSRAAKLSVLCRQANECIHREGCTFKSCGKVHKVFLALGYYCHARAVKPVVAAIVDNTTKPFGEGPCGHLLPTQLAMHCFKEVLRGITADVWASAGMLWVHHALQGLHPDGALPGEVLRELGLDPADLREQEEIENRLRVEAGRLWDLQQALWSFVRKCLPRDGKIRTAKLNSFFMSRGECRTPAVLKNELLGLLTDLDKSFEGQPLRTMYDHALEPLIERVTEQHQLACERLHANLLCVLHRLIGVVPQDLHLLHDLFDRVEQHHREVPFCAGVLSHAEEGKMVVLRERVGTLRDRLRELVLPAGTPAAPRAPPPPAPPGGPAVQVPTPATELDEATLAAVEPAEGLVGSLLGPAPPAATAVQLPMPAAGLDEAPLAAAKPLEASGGSLLGQAAAAAAATARPLGVPPGEPQLWLPPPSVAEPQQPTQPRASHWTPCPQHEAPSVDLPLPAWPPTLTGVASAAAAVVETSFGLPQRLAQPPNELVTATATLSAVQQPWEVPQPLAQPGASPLQGAAPATSPVHAEPVLQPWVAAAAAAAVATPTVLLDRREVLRQEEPQTTPQVGEPVEVEGPQQGHSTAVQPPSGIIETPALPLVVPVEPPHPPHAAAAAAVVAAAPAGPAVGAVGPVQQPATAPEEPQEEPTHYRLEVMMDGAREFLRIHKDVQELPKHLLTEEHFFQLGLPIASKRLREERHMKELRLHVLGLALQVLRNEEWPVTKEDLQDRIPDLNWAPAAEEAAAVDAD